MATTTRTRFRAAIAATAPAVLLAEFERNGRGGTGGVTVEAAEWFLDTNEALANIALEDSWEAWLWYDTGRTLLDSRGSCSRGLAVSQRLGWQGRPWNVASI